MAKEPGDDGVKAGEAKTAAPTGAFLSQGDRLRFSGGLQADVQWATPELAPWGLGVTMITGSRSNELRTFLVDTSDAEVRSGDELHLTSEQGQASAIAQVPQPYSISDLRGLHPVDWDRVESPSEADPAQIGPLLGRTHIDLTPAVMSHGQSSLAEEEAETMAASETRQEEAPKAPRQAVPRAEPVSAPAQQKASTPAGKVKASFNFVPSDLQDLRQLARELGTTVTTALQRAIRDEIFIRDHLARGERLALVDRDGAVREIMWR